MDSSSEDLLNDMQHSDLEPSYLGVGSCEQNGKEQHSYTDDKTALRGLEREAGAGTSHGEVSVQVFQKN